MVAYRYFKYALYFRKWIEKMKEMSPPDHRSVKAGYVQKKGWWLHGCVLHSAIKRVVVYSSNGEEVDPIVYVPG